MFHPNFQLCTDSYKVSHSKQLRPGTTGIYSHFMSRGGAWKECVFVGLQPKLHILHDAVFNSSLVQAQRIWHAHFQNDSVYNRSDWYQICQLGHLPLLIRALPEGTIVPPQVPMFTVENTDKRFPWLTNWVETILVQTWYPITVATVSREFKRLLAKYLMQTVGNTDGIDFMLHDFGFRGATSVESAAIGGAAHLTNFKGTDTAVALPFLEEYYQDIAAGTYCAGYSIPAAEHSTVTSWGKQREAEAYKHVMDAFPDGLVAIVSDSYDIYNACANIWGGVLKPYVLERKGTVVIRPDSGTPHEVVVKCLDILGDKFGYTTNQKGYKQLHPKVRVIQGDGITIDSVPAILDGMVAHEWAANNVAFGMGAGLLQKVDRDTLKMAMKCSETTCGGEVVEVFKDPVTDPGKRSPAGRLAVIRNIDGELQAVRAPHRNDLLEEVFRDGKILKRHLLEDIRQRARL